MSLYPSGIVLTTSRIRATCILIQTEITPSPEWTGGNLVSQIWMRVNSIIKCIVEMTKEIAQHK